MTANVISPPLLTGRVVEGPASARISIDARQYINFFGGGYLALAVVPEIRAAVRDALDRGAAFAQQIPVAKGTIEPAFEAVERTAAAAFKTEASVYFSSGYFIGPVGLSSIEKANDIYFIDEHAHYNLKDATRARSVPTFTFAHCSVDSLRESLGRHVIAGQRPIVITDGVFPTSGRVAPLAEYAAEIARYEGHLFIDESHAFGVVGDTGRGAAEYCGVENVASIGATLSKAYCAQGAVVACSADAARRLRELPVIRGACAGSPLSAAAATASLAYVASHPEIRNELRHITDYLRSGLRLIGLNVIDSPAPIVSFKCGTGADMRALQRRAFDKGIFINHSTYVGSGLDGMFVCALFRDHSREDVDMLLDMLRSSA